MTLIALHTVWIGLNSPGGHNDIKKGTIKKNNRQEHQHSKT